MTNYEINWQAMAPGPYLSEKYEWSLDMSDSDASCNSSPVDSNSMGSYQSSPTDTTWDYIPLVEKALGSMPIDELFPEPNLGNHQELLNYDYCDNPLASKNTSALSLDLIDDINNFALPDTVDPMSNEDTTRFDLTQFLCEDMNQDNFDVKVCKVEPFQDEVCKVEPFQDEVPSQPMQEVKLEQSIKLEEEEALIDSETEIDVESVPDGFKPFFDSVDHFQPSKGKQLKAKDKCLKKVSKRPTKPKLMKKEQKIIPQMKTVPIGKKDLKQFIRASSAPTDSKKGVEYKKNVVSAPQKNISHGVVDKIAPPAIIEASDGIGLLDQLEMFDLQMNQDGTKTAAKKPVAKQVPQRRTIAVEALPQSKRSKGKESKKLKEAQKSISEVKDPQPVEVKSEVIVEPPRQNAQQSLSNKPASYKIVVDAKNQSEKKKLIAQPMRTLKEIPVINPQDWLYTPQKVQKPPIAKLKLVRSLPESQKASGQQISAAVLQQLQEKTKNKKIIVTQMLPVWKVEKPSKPAIQAQKSVFRSQTMHHNSRPVIQPIAQVKTAAPKVSRAVEISTQTEPEKPLEAKKVLHPTPSKKPGCWQVDHDYLNGASLVKPNYKPPMVSILKANVNKIKAQNDLAQKKKAVQDKQEIIQLKRKVVDDVQEVQPKKILKLEDYKQRKPIPIAKPQIREEPIIENITLAPFVPPSSVPMDQPPAAVAQEHPYVAPRPIPSHLQMKVSRGVNTSQSWAHLEQMAKNHGLQFSCNSLITSMLEQLPENDISDKIFEDVVVTFAEKKKEKVETCEVGTQVGTVKSRSRSQSPARSTFGIQKTLGRGWGNKARTFKDILDSVMERRVVFVGGIREGTTNAQLASLFVRFGEVEHTNIIYEKKWQDGPDYCGFVTFEKADIAYDVISSGNLYQGLEHFQLNFGGRRLFLQTPGYSDLDNMKDDEIYVKEEEQYEESFAESLQIAHRMLKKQGKIS